MEIYPNNEIKQELKPIDKGSIKNGKYGNYKRLFSAFFFFLKVINVQEIIMTHKNISEEGRENPRQWKKINFSYKCLRTLPCDHDRDDEKLPGGAFEDLCWENIISLEKRKDRQCTMK